VFIGEELTFNPRPRPGPRPPLHPTGPAKVECPTAAQNAFPDREATLNVHPPKTLPTEGIYRWKREGEQIQPDPLDPSKTYTQQISGMEERALHNVVVASESDTRLQYTYQTVQRNLGTATYTLTKWFVDSNPQADQEVNSPASDDRLTAGEPERGIVIRGFDTLDSRGDNVNSVNFSPRAGLLVAPLPIRTGESFSSVSVDTRSGQTFRLDGKVIKRVQVDACGTVIAGWLVESRLESSSASATYNYVVAPQFGGILLQEVVDEQAQTETGMVHTKVTFTIGQQEPDPLPEED
jgi:hypothetical protein